MSQVSQQLTILSSSSTTTTSHHKVPMLSCYQPTAKSRINTKIYKQVKRNSTHTHSITFNLPFLLQVSQGYSKRAIGSVFYPPNAI